MVFEQKYVYLKAFAVAFAIALGSMQTAEAVEIEKVEYNQPSKGYWFIGFGPAATAGMNTKEGYGTSSFGYAWTWSDYMFRLEFDSVFTRNSENRSLSSLGFSGRYFLNSGLTRFFAIGSLHSTTYSIETKDKSEREIDGYMWGTGAGILWASKDSVAFELAAFTRFLNQKVDSKIPTANGASATIYW